LRAEQTHTSVLYGDRFVLKFLRLIDEGVNPELELGRFLAERTEFRNVPPVAGYLEFRPRRGQPMTLGVLQGYVAHQGDGWKSAVNGGGGFAGGARAGPAGPGGVGGGVSRRERAGQAPPPLAQELMGPELEAFRLLGQRTAEFHRALASATDDPD